MATFNSGIGPDKGSADEFTFYMRNGKMVMRKKHRRVRKDDRTPLGMETRVKWMNVINCWSALKPCVLDLFEKDRSGKTVYNWFVALNRPVSTVYLTQAESERHYTVIDRYYISHGSLTPAVETHMKGNTIISNLNIGELEIDGNTRVSDLSTALLQEVNGLKSGDELIFVSVWQSDRCENFESIEPSRWSFKLDLHDQRPLLLALGLEDGRRGLLCEEGRLAADLGDQTLGAWVVKRTDANGTAATTTQRLAGNSWILDGYSDKMQRFKAVYSYGGVRQYSYYSRRGGPKPDSIMFAPGSDYGDD